MDSAALRALFRRYAGPERYRRFMRAINGACRGKGRLFFWQEQLWRAFAETAPGTPMNDTDVMRVFAVCDVHECPLLQLAEETPLPEVRDTPEYEQARDNLFPFANDRNFVCSQCQAARERWIADNAELCRILRCQTTYAEYCHRRFYGLADQPGLREKIKAREAEITAQLGPGDELWEWDAGGWHRLAGRAGVAIVNNGQIVKQWCDVRS